MQKKDLKGNYSRYFDNGNRKFACFNKGLCTKTSNDDRKNQFTLKKPHKPSLPRRSFSLKPLKIRFKDRQNTKFGLKSF